MPRGDLWDAFVKTGRIEDNLRYCGVDIYRQMNSAAPPAGKEPPSHASDNRRPDHPGEQQYR